MSNEASLFAERLREACDSSSACPDGHGSGSWLQRKLEGVGISVSRQAVSNWQRGNTIPRRETLAALAAILDVKPSWLAGLAEGSASITETSLATGSDNFSLPVPLGNGRAIEISQIPFDLTEAEAQRVCKVIMALAA